MSVVSVSLALFSVSYIFVSAFLVFDLFDFIIRMSASKMFRIGKKCVIFISASIVFVSAWFLF